MNQLARIGGESSTRRSNKVLPRGWFVGEDVLSYEVGDAGSNPEGGSYTGTTEGGHDITVVHTEDTDSASDVGKTRGAV